MLERHIVLDGADPAIFYGVQNANLRVLKALFPKLRIIARDNVIKAIGDELEIAAFEEHCKSLEQHVVEYNRLTEEEVLTLIKGERKNNAQPSDIIVYSTGGKPIAPRTENQKRIVASWNESDMIFAIGPAGSGKTYVAIALAVKALKNKEIRKIILSRPAVEAGEKLGFLPGDMKEKVDPYLQPLYDALQEMIPAAKLQEYLDTQVIQIAPLAFMRGRTLNDAVVILDEAQNTTSAQLKMFLTRMGANTKMIITGDYTQIDLPSSQRSGLVEAIHILKDVKGISFIQLGKEDIVRHRLVTRIVQAYEKAEKEQLKANATRNAEANEKDIVKPRRKTTTRTATSA